MNTRTERTISFNRKNILEAADKLFTQNGIEKTTMDMIAVEAGYSKPTLYGYFKDKNEVYFALVLDFMQKITEQVNVIAAQELPFADTYKNICEFVFRLAVRYPLYFEGLIGKINVDILSPDTPVIYKELYERGEELNGVIGKLVQRGKDEDMINKNLEDSAVILYLWSSVSGIIRMSLLKKDYIKILKLNENDFSGFCFERLLLSLK